MEILSIDFTFEPYIIQSDDCVDRVTSPECIAEEGREKVARDRKCKKVPKEFFELSSVSYIYILKCLACD